jgi:hypothetical protein
MSQNLVTLVDANVGVVDAWLDAEAFLHSRGGYPPLVVSVVVVGPAIETPNPSIVLHHFHILVEVVVIDILHAELHNFLVEGLNFVGEPLGLRVRMASVDFGDGGEGEAVFHDSGSALEAGVEIGDELGREFRGEEVAKVRGKDLRVEACVDVLKLE